jgi:hypothetical protein
MVKSPRGQEINGGFLPVDKTERQKMDWIKKAKDVLQKMFDRHIIDLERIDFSEDGFAVVSKNMNFGPGVGTMEVEAKIELKEVAYMLEDMVDFFDEGKEENLVSACWGWTNVALLNEFDRDCDRIKRNLDRLARETFSGIA